MKNLQAGRSVSTLQVLEVLSDRISVDMFNSIAEKVTTSDNLVQLLGVTARQYYTRQSYLMKTGLIQRRHGVLTLTSLGYLIYRALLIIASACRQYILAIRTDETKFHDS